MTRETVTAIITAYNPPQRLLGTVTRLADQVDNIIVVDDGSNHASASILDDLETHGVTVMRHGVNMGIAAALNTGIAGAQLKLKPQFYLTLDQDSIIDDDYVSKALNTFQQAELALISVGFICAETYNNEPINLEASESNFVRPFDPWQSGLLIPGKTFEKVGLFAEDFFIDAVDSEFTLRVRRAGMHPIVGEGCNVTHEIGEQRTPKFFGRKVSFGGKMKTFSAHPPVRVYYMIRNGILLWRKYESEYPTWLKRKAYYDMKGHFVRLFFGTHSLRILTAILLGAVDGLLGRNGRIGSFSERLLS